jgi:hypothetical protein
VSFQKKGGIANKDDFTRLGRESRLGQFLLEHF